MDYREAIMTVTWMNQMDPLVLISDANIDKWANALRVVSIQDARQAVLDHYRLTVEARVPTPAGIAQRAKHLANSRKAKQQAIEAGASDRATAPPSWFTQWRQSGSPDPAEYIPR